MKRLRWAKITIQTLLTIPVYCSGAGGRYIRPAATYYILGGPEPLGIISLQNTETGIPIIVSNGGIDFLLLICLV